MACRRPHATRFKIQGDGLERRSARPLDLGYHRSRRDVGPSGLLGPGFNANRSSLPLHTRRYRLATDKPLVRLRTLEPTFRTNQRPMHRQIRSQVQRSYR